MVFVVLWLVFGGNGVKKGFSRVKFQGGYFPRHYSPKETPPRRNPMDKEILRERRNRAGAFCSMRFFLVLSK
ncbi:hypothetical protein DXN05_21730 [Deminuibacter soli]|uniref:Uncharacterized protein n=1 Tax=Deminuibacter soli TaxID=2291815 RepID=A0A3E1NE25_9BACT|nr:hypothetical protein DXN05_21730 [Deminuibacter soli]